MFATWFLFLLACPGQDGGEAFQKGLERVRRLEDKNQWSRAKEELDLLLEEHRESDYVLHRLPELREVAKRIHFWLRYEPPDPKELTGGELLKYSPSTGQIKLRYRRPKGPKKHLSDFEREGDVFAHPLLFDGKHSVTLKGDSFHDEAIVFVGFHGDQLISVFLDPGGGEAVMSLVKGEFYKKLLDFAEDVKYRTRKPYEIKVTVRDGSATVKYNKKLILQSKDVENVAGRIAFMGSEPDEVLLEGNATTAWIEGLVSEAVDADRSSFEKEFDPKTVLPEWLLAMNKAAVIPFRPPYPDPKNREHLMIWSEIEGLVAEEEYGSARRMIGKLDEKRTTEVFREFALAYVDAEDERLEDALDRLRHVKELDPEFSGARVLEARIRLGQGSRKQALGILERITLDDPLEVNAWHWLIHLQLYEDAALAKGTLDRALRAGIPPATLASVNRTLVRAEQGPKWGRTFERETKHYRIASNLNLSVCVEATKILEEALQLYRKDFPRLTPLSAKKRRYPVYLFAGEAGYQSYVGDLGRGKPEWTAGLYFPDLKQLLIWNLPDREAMFRTVRHEGLHQYLDSVLPNPPAWLNEGLAEYYEVSDPSRGFGEAGRPREDHLELLLSRSRKWTSFERFLHMSYGDFQRKPSLHYAQAWGLSQFLMHSDREERKRLDGYLTALAQERPWLQAAEVILDGRDEEAFRKEVRTYLIELDKER